MTPMDLYVISVKKKLKNIVFNRSATVKLSEAGGVSKWYYDQKMTSFFSFRFIRVFVSHLTGKIMRLKFYPNAAFFECKFTISRSAIIHSQD